MRSLARPSTNCSTVRRRVAGRDQRRGATEQPREPEHRGQLRRRQHRPVDDSPADQRHPIRAWATRCVESDRDGITVGRDVQRGEEPAERRPHPRPEEVDAGVDGDPLAVEIDRDRVEMAAQSALALVERDAVNVAEQPRGDEPRAAPADDAHVHAPDPLSAPLADRQDSRTRRVHACFIGAAARWTTGAPWLISRYHWGRLTFSARPERSRNAPNAGAPSVSERGRHAVAAPAFRWLVRGGGRVAFRGRDARDGPAGHQGPASCSRATRTSRMPRRTTDCMARRGFSASRGAASSHPRSNPKLVGEFRDDRLGFARGLHFQIPETSRDPELPRLRRPVSLRRAHRAGRGHGGKQFYAWGTADFFNPTDNINPYDYLDVLERDKLAVWSAAARLPRVRRLVFVVVPVFTPSRVPLFRQPVTPEPPPGFQVIADDRVLPDSRTPTSARRAAADDGGRLGRVGELLRRLREHARLPPVARGGGARRRRPAADAGLHPREVRASTCPRRSARSNSTPRRRPLRRVQRPGRPLPGHRGL